MRPYILITAIPFCEYHLNNLTEANSAQKIGNVYRIKQKKNDGSESEIYTCQTYLLQ